jgi:oligopeptide/dipeptide ABC transporter ATP-binding protein
LRSIPRLSHLDERIHPIEGQVPELIDLPAGCRFQSRCAFAEPACEAFQPMRSPEGERGVRCRLADEDAAA